MAESLKYVGLLLNIGLTKKKSLSAYWTVRPSQATPFYSSVMAYDLFILISRMLHLNNIMDEKERGDEGFDPWCKVRWLLDHINHVSKHHYIPSRNISIDESMIGMKNRVVYIQYMPNKRHAQFGIKKFQLCDSNGYVYHVDLYSGKDFDVRHDEGQAFGVVEKLMTQGHLLNKGYHLFTDNFYTKPRLAEFLYENKTLLTGTVRANSKGMPKTILQKLDIGQGRYFRKVDGSMLAIAFREKKSQTKPVLIINTAHDAGLERRMVKGKEKNKPYAIYDYNTFMGGVDLSDKQIYHYAAERSTRRYWKKIFHNLIDTAVLNSWIIYSLVSDMPLSRDNFIMRIVESLCADEQPAPEARAPTPQPHAVQHALVRLEGKKEMDCFVCSDRISDRKKSTGRKRSRRWCPACKVGCHEKCESQLEHITNQGLQKRRRGIDE